MWILLESHLWNSLCFFGSRKIKTKIPEADDLPINVRPKSSPSTRSPVGHPVCSCSSIFFRTRPFYETVESTWLKQLNVKRIESKILGQNFTCTNSSTIWASNLNCSSTALGQKLQRNLEAGHILWDLVGQVRQNTHLDQVFFFDLPPELFPVFPLKKFMGILPGLHSISFTCISNMRTSWNMGFFDS